MIRFLISATVLFLLHACATFEVNSTSAPVVSVPHTAEDTNSLGWHSVAFSINWPENGAPAWHVDAFLANTVCKDTLDTYGSDMVVWRFHRRAVRDPTGHRFSFKFYGTEALAGNVYRAIENHPVAGQLLASGIVTDIKRGPVPGNKLAQIADTSDPAWSPPLRASWPYFAMGVSQSWLALIGQVAQDSLPISDSAPLGAHLAFYESVNAQVSQYWRHEGSHAYLHHLNALFGYEEIIVRERRSTRF